LTKKYAMFNKDMQANLMRVRERSCAASNVQRVARMAYLGNSQAVEILTGHQPRGNGLVSVPQAAPIAPSHNNSIGSLHRFLEIAVIFRPHGI
jgi:hypothetical protein